MHLREGRLDDLPQIATIGSDALWDDEIVQYLAPHRSKYPLSHRDNYLFRSKRRFFGGDRLVVAVADEDDENVAGQGEIMGFAFWSDTLNTSAPPQKPFSILGNGFEQMMLRIEGHYRWYMNIDRSYDKLRFAKFWHVLAQNPFFEDITDYWELEVLAIAPRYQRRGVGSQLLRWGMDQAASFELPVVVAATTSGEHLYNKHGFKKCGKIDFENSQFSWTSLVWRPNDKLVR